MESDNLPMECWPDERLLHAAHTGDTKAFEVFCTRALPGLLRYLRMHCRRFGTPSPDELASDLAQDALVRALSQAAAYRRGDVNNFPRATPTWLFRIGYNLLMDWLRRQRISPIVPVDVVETAAQPAPCEVEQREEVLKFLNWLPDRDRELLELIYLKGMKPTAAGAELGLTEAASYKAHQRALETLRDLVSEHGMVVQGGTR